MKLERDKYLHSKEHVLADDLSQVMGEQKKFAAYLGIAKLYYESDLRALAKYVSEKKDLPAEARGKYFFGALRGLPRKPRATFRRRKKKKKKMPNVRTITKEPNKVLRKKAGAVTLREIASPKIQELIRDMKETLQHTPDGVGLAAPQVGVGLQIFIVSEEAEEIDKIEKELKKESAVKTAETGEKPYESREWKYYVFINPVVKNMSKRRLERAEGCLSVPGKFGEVKRHEKITVEAHDEHGKKFTRGASRFFARVIQHELDHLQGALFIDRAEKVFESVSGKKEI